MSATITSTLNKVSNSIMSNFYRIKNKLLTIICNGEIVVRTENEYMVNVFKIKGFAKASLSDLIDIVNSFQSNFYFTNLYNALCISPDVVGDMPKIKLLHILYMFDIYDNEEFVNHITRYVIEKHVC